LISLILVYLAFFQSLLPSRIFFCVIEFLLLYSLTLVLSDDLAGRYDWNKREANQGTEGSDQHKCWVTRKVVFGYTHEFVVNEGAHHWLKHTLVEVHYACKKSEK
jgi:hypothetical protein